MVPSPIGPIPQGWEVKRLKDVADIRWGDTSKTKASYVEDGYDAYSASGLDGKMDHYDFDRKGVVLSAIGANCGKTWFASGRWSCIKNTIRFWSTSESISTEFLFVATLREDFWPRRGAAQPFISQGDAEQTQLVCPDKAIMVTFTAFADAALQQISALTRVNANLRRTRDLLLPRLLSGQIDLKSMDAVA
jgi:type I restriction enzyme S subunit